MTFTNANKILVDLAGLNFFSNTYPYWLLISRVFNFAFFEIVKIHEIKVDLQKQSLQILSTQYSILIEKIQITIFY